MSISDFSTYFGLGTEHILTWEALDHILFITALCLRYQIADWKKVVVLVTAFTIGHSITLACSAFGLISFPTRWIEFFIPLTIVATAIDNFRVRKKIAITQTKLPVIYFLALFFGCIHGMAYANTFLALEGREGLIGHLFAFNLGIEVAQLLVVVAVLAISFIFVALLRLPRQAWITGASILICLASLKMAIDRLPFKSNKTAHQHEINPHIAYVYGCTVCEQSEHTKQPEFQSRQQV